MKNRYMYAIPVENTDSIMWVMVNQNHNIIFKAVSTKDVYKSESEPGEQFGRRLCDTGNINFNK